MQRGVSNLKVSLALVVVFMLLMAAGCVSSQSRAEKDVASVTQDIVTVKGKVKAVSVEDGVITIKPRKSGKVTIGFDGGTSFKGMASAKEIKKGQPVKILYKTEGDKKKAVTVEKLLDGC